MYTAELVDDGGKQVRAVETSTKLNLAERGSEAHATLSTPAALSDGFYQLRVIAAFSGTGGETVTNHSWYFAVAAGDIEELDFSQWIERSMVMTGTVTP